MIEFDGNDLHLTYYLSGPMTGYHEFNYAAFERASTRLRGMGVKIISPHEIPAPGTKIQDEQLWEYYMAKCKEQVAKCEAIIMLRGWPESKGAKQELQWALDRELPVFLYLENPGRLIRMSRRNDEGQQ